MAEKYTLNIDVNTSKAVKSVDKLDDAIKDTTKDTGNLDGAVGGLDKATGGLVTKFAGLKVGLKGITGGFKSMRLAIISTGIGALVLGITALAAAFTGSEEGQNKFAKIMSVIGALTGNLVDLLADLGEGIIDAFENPMESMESFFNFFKDNIVNRFEGFLNLIPSLGKAVEQFFKGNFSEAAKIAADSAGMVFLGVEGITEKLEGATKAVKDFAAEQVKEAKMAASVADMRAKADKIERGLVVDRSKLESEIALLRLKSRQEDQFSATERKQALLDAQVLEDQLLDKETEFLELRRDAQVLENTFSRSNKENLDKEAQAIAAVNRQQASRANVARQVQREVNTISKQIEGEEKAAANELANFKKTLRDAEAATLQEKRDLELIKIREQYALLREEAILNNVAVDELDAARDIVLKEKQDAFDLADQLAKDKIIADAKLRADEKKKIQEKELADSKAITDAKIQIAKEEEAAKLAALNGYASALSSISGIMSKETEAGKGLAIASSLVNTFAAISGQLKAFSGVPVPGYAIAQAIATGVVGLANVKKIASVKIPNSSGGGSAPNIPSISTAVVQATAQTPSFDILGTSGTNQLASALGQQAPVQAFVVSQDVTTAQSLQNNIIQGATLGG
mgnify:FL=1